MHHVIIGKDRDSEFAIRSGAGATSALVLVEITDDILPPLKWDSQIVDRLGDATKPRRLSITAPIVHTRNAILDCEIVEASDLKFTVK
jgi:hypothetical protein